MKRLLVVNGHPDPRPERFCSALCSAYLQGAEMAGWDACRLEIGELPLSSLQALERGDPPHTDVSRALDHFRWADRLAIVYPLWFDQPPAALRTLMGHWACELASARRAQLVVTMDMPAFAWRSMLRPGAGNTSLALSLAGIVPDDPILIGSVGSITVGQRRAWLETMQACGRSWAGGAIPPVWTLAAAIDCTMSHFGLG